ncbi:MAG: hypothetical protein ACON5F_06130 [Jejuia sp.]
MKYLIVLKIELKTKKICKAPKAKKDKLYKSISFEKSSNRGKLGLEGLISKYKDPNIKTINTTIEPTRCAFVNILFRLTSNLKWK